MIFPTAASRPFGRAVPLFFSHFPLSYHCVARAAQSKLRASLLIPAHGTLHTRDFFRENSSKISKHHDLNHS